MATIRDLLAAGSIDTGDDLVWVSRIQGETHKATISPNGEIRTADGKLHKTPSGALKHLNGNKPVDGWLAWKVKKSGKPLASLRSEIVS